MTSGNGTGNNNNNNKSSSRQHTTDEAKAAQAIVKSHILTHLIEGFVIQEGAEPFPVSLPDTWADQSRGIFLFVMIVSHLASLANLVSHVVP